MTGFGTQETRKLRVLDFDTECRPMHYSEWRPESQITAYAWSWEGESHVECRLLARDLSNESEAFLDFYKAYQEADLVVGHYIRKHDLPLLNDHCIRLFGAKLLPKLTCDTQADLPKVKGLGKSQENLALEFGLSEEKHHMAGALWREANTLSPNGEALARERVVSDVIQNKALRKHLLGLGLLSKPKVWRP